MAMDLQTQISLVRQNTEEKVLKRTSSDNTNFVMRSEAGDEGKD